MSWVSSGFSYEGSDAVDLYFLFIGAGAGRFVISDPQGQQWALNYVAGGACTPSDVSIDFSQASTISISGDIISEGGMLSQPSDFVGPIEITSGGGIIGSDGASAAVITFNSSGGGATVHKGHVYTSGALNGIGIGVSLCTFAGTIMSVSAYTPIPTVDPADPSTDPNDTPIVDF